MSAVLMTFYNFQNPICSLRNAWIPTVSEGRLASPRPTSRPAGRLGRTVFFYFPGRPAGPDGFFYSLGRPAGPEEFFFFSGPPGYCKK